MTTHFMTCYRIEITNLLRKANEDFTLSPHLSISRLETISLIRPCSDSTTPIYRFDTRCKNEANAEHEVDIYY